IALIIEQLRDGPRFIQAATRARRAGKPIIALKCGRSEAGRRAALSHTGAIAGEHRTLSGVFEQLGVVEVDSLDRLLNSAHALAGLPRPAGRRIGILSPSGGEGGYLADRASDR